MQTTHGINDGFDGIVIMEMVAAKSMLVMVMMPLVVTKSVAIGKSRHEINKLRTKTLL